MVIYCATQEKPGYGRTTATESEIRNELKKLSNKPTSEPKIVFQLRNPIYSGIKSGKRQPLIKERIIMKANGNSTKMTNILSINGFQLSLIVSMPFR